jgi:hypothetical protein
MQKYNIIITGFHIMAWHIFRLELEMFPDMESSHNYVEYASCRQQRKVEPSSMWVGWKPTNPYHKKDFTTYNMLPRIGFGYHECGNKPSCSF